MKWWTVIAWMLMVITVQEQEVAGSRILFIDALGSVHHQLFYNAMVDTLANNGHNITYVSYYEPTRVRKNVRDLVIKDLETAEELMKKNPRNGYLTRDVLSDNIPELCCDALEKKEIQNLLKQEFDLGMVSTYTSECFLSLFYQLKIPHISVCSTDMNEDVNAMMGNSLFTSFVASTSYLATHPFTFTDRFFNLIVTNYAETQFRGDILPRIDAECRRRGLCPETMPSLNEMRQTASLLFVNSVRTLEVPPQPHMPNIIHVGGIHIKEPKPLPKDLESWVSGSPAGGFVFVDFGMSVNSDNMPEKYRKILVEALGMLNFPVVWKWDQTTIEDLPHNILIRKKFPTQDILGDPRLLIFVTAGEPMSTMTAMYHGKPVLGLPAYFAEMTVMRNVDHQGWGYLLKWADIDAMMLRNVIYVLMVNKRINGEVKRRSVVMHDRQLTPQQAINYWVGYVIRHKGAHHLRSPILSMEWYQVYNVDVWLFMVLIIVGLFYGVLRTLLLIFEICWSYKPKYKRD